MSDLHEEGTMARRRFGGSNFARRVGPRRKVTWDGQDTIGTLFFGNLTRTSSAAVSLFTTGFVITNDQVTLTRSLLDIYTGFRASDATGNVAVVSIGMIVVGAEAFGQGAAAVPDPRTRAEDDWIFLGHYFLKADSTTVSTGSSGHDMRQALDLRS